VKSKCAVSSVSPPIPNRSIPRPLFAPAEYSDVYSIIFIDTDGQLWSLDPERFRIKLVQLSRVLRGRFLLPGSRLRISFREGGVLSDAAAWEQLVKSEAWRRLNERHPSLARIVECAYRQLPDPCVNVA
jgi:hypothetical protein